MHFKLQYFTQVKAVFFAIWLLKHLRTKYLYIFTGKSMYHILEESVSF